jgi:hypothetical protein
MIIELEIENLIRDEVSRQLNERSGSMREDREPEICVGQRQLADKLHVSLMTVNRWHKEGRFDGCYTQISRKIVYNLDKIKKMSLK